MQIARRLFCLLTVVLAVFACSTAAEAEVIFCVDINGGDGPTQDGWNAFDPTGPKTFTDALGAGSDVTVAMSHIGNPADVRDKDRGTTVTGTYASLSNLLRDFYGTRNIGGEVVLSLTLDAGEYYFKSYHHDAEATTMVQNGDIWVGDDGPVTALTLNNGTAPTTIATYETTLVLAEAGTVDIHLKKTAGGGGELGFNGFELSAVPEPSTTVLGAFGLLAMIGFGWRRRRATAVR